MRTAQRRVVRNQVSNVVSLTSPMGGLNARDPIGNQKPTDALILDNIFCTPYNVMVRHGYSVHASGLPLVTNTLSAYASPTVDKMFAFSSSSVYDVSASGAIGSPVVQGTSNSKFQSINFGTSGGNFLVSCNGDDLPLIYNGSVWSNAFSAAFNSTVTSITSVSTTATITWANPHNLKTGMSVTVAGFTPAGYNGTYVITVTGASTATYTLSGALGVTTVTGTAAPVVSAAITGVNPASLIYPMAFKSRLWFIQKETNLVWYLPVLSIGGAAQSIDLGNLFSDGGKVVAMADWSLDAGYGIDDYAVFISSNGQTAVFKGTDPASPSTWSLVGVYNLGAPVGTRCVVKYAGDLVFLCKDGLQPLSKALMSTRVNNKSAITDKIQHTISQYMSTYGSNFGWEIATFPAQNMLLVNVPLGNGSSYQLVMNTISGAWSRFLNWDVTTFCLYQDELYFGSTNYVAKAWDTFSDNGSNISFEAQQSFSYFGRTGVLKKCNMIRPVISSSISPLISIGVNADFDQSSPTGIPSFSPTSVAVWDVALWDDGLWGGDLQIFKDWKTAFAIGYCLSVHMIGSVNGSQLQWESTDYMFESGGAI